MDKGEWFKAVTNKPARLYDGTDEGRSMAVFFPCLLEDGTKITASITLVNNNGEVRDKGFKLASEILGAIPSDFPWKRVDGTDESTVGLQISVVRSGNFWNAYPAGSEKVTIDAEALKVRYGMQLRAKFGGRPGRTNPALIPQSNPAPAPTAPAPASQQCPVSPPSPVSRAPVPPGPVSTQMDRLSTLEACWKAFYERNTRLDGDQLGAAFADVVVNCCNKEQADMTETDWGRVWMAVTDGIPF